MSADQQKQQALVAIVTAAVKPGFTGLEAQLARLQVDLGTVLARIDILDTALNQGNGAGVKRAVKPAGGTKKGGKAAGGPPKLTNTLLYFRHMMATDETFRGNYIPETDEWKGHAQLANKDEEKDPHAYWSAAGNAIWGTLEEAVKADIKSQFATYKEELARGNGDAQLEADP